MLDSSSISNITLSLAKDEVVSLTKQNKDPKPGFIMVGNGESTRRMVEQSIDLLQAIAEMNSNEKLCFFSIRDGIMYSRYDNRMIYQVKLDMSEFTKSQKSKFSNGYTSLYNKDLVRRVSKGVYMINPNALIPSEYRSELNIWNSLDKKEGNE